MDSGVLGSSRAKGSKLYFDTMSFSDIAHEANFVISQGKILYPAVSNFAGWQVAEALGISACHDRTRFEVVQPMNNPVKRQ